MLANFGRLFDSERNTSTALGLHPLLLHLTLKRQCMLIAFGVKIEKIYAYSKCELTSLKITAENGFI